MHAVVGQNRNESVGPTHRPICGTQNVRIRQCRAPQPLMAHNHHWWLCAIEDRVQKAQGSQKFYVPQVVTELRKAAALRREWQGGGQQRRPSGAAAQAVAEVVEAPRQLFISALSRPHEAYNVASAVCSRVLQQWYLAALFADEFIDIRCLLALGAKARGHDRGSQAQRGRYAGRLRRRKPIWLRCSYAASTRSTHGGAL